MGLLSRRRNRKMTRLPVNKPGAKIKMLLVVNPYATTVSDRLKNVVVYALQSRYEITTIETRERNHATTIVRDAIGRGDYDLVCSFGGDGTANEVINGVYGSEVPFTFLPGGMTNVIGRIMGIPGDIVDATEHLLTQADHFEPRRVDLGDANGRKFIFAAGCGLDAEIVERCEARPAMKRRFGQNFYAWAAVQTFAGQLGRRAPLEIEIAGEKLKGIVAVAQNGRPFTYFGRREIDLASSAGLEKRALALTVLDRANPLDFAPVATRLLSQKLPVSGNRHVHVFDDVARAVVRRRREDGKKVALQTDGDYIGHFDEVVITSLPAALNVVA